MAHDPAIGPVVHRLHTEHGLHGAERPLRPPHVPAPKHQFSGFQIHLAREQDVLAVEAFVVPYPAPVVICVSFTPSVSVTLPYRPRSERPPSCTG